MGALVEGWDAYEVHLNNSNLSRLTPEIPSCPILVKLFLQENRSLTSIPPSFFDHMPALQVLDLSYTSLQSLPPSISKLVSLQEFILKDCSLLRELPPEIQALKNLKLLDLEGTEIIYLPKEIRKLKNLEYLRVSLSAYANDYRERKGIENIIPRMTLSKLTRLKELSILVNPEADWWELEVMEAILEDLRSLPDLETLKLYLPTSGVLQRFLQLESYRVPIYASLWNFRLVIGHREQLTCSLPPHAEENFDKLEKCLKYINGEGSTGDIAKLIRTARALFLCCHWTIEKLSVFDINKLKYCLVTECNEMQTVFDGKDMYEDGDISKDKGEKAALGALEYLGIYCMKKLRSMWRGPVAKNCLSCLRILCLHACPVLTTIFTPHLLDNLQSLAELIVEDCPRVKSLVSLEPSPSPPGCFLPNLKRIFLLDLPELISISSGLCIAPELDTLLVFNCMKLLNLSTLELPNDNMKEIKGEREWWDALTCDKFSWCSIFVELQRDGDLMDQLAEETNSLQRFHRLLKISRSTGNRSKEKTGAGRVTVADASFSHAKRVERQMGFSMDSPSSHSVLTFNPEKEGNIVEISSSPQDGCFGGTHLKDSESDVRSFRDGNLDDSAILADIFQKESEDSSSPISSPKSTEIQNDDEGGNGTSTTLNHNLNFPTCSVDSSTLGTPLQLDEPVLSRIRLKKDPLVHPRLIAEKSRRKQAREKMRKLQELLPNMDKQMTTVDVLDSAVDYLTELRKQVEALEASHAKGTS